MRSRALVALLLALVAVAVLAPSAPGAKPQTVVVNIDDSGPDDFLTAECGVPVTFHAVGRVTLRTFVPNGAAGPLQVNTVNVAVTVSSGDNSYRFRDVGADHLQQKPDGSLVLSIIGQLPFDFTGVLKIDPETGDVLHEPSHSIEDRLDDACAALKA
jgi:hypothetical protein